MKNSVFNFRRFLKVLRKDIREGVRQNWSLPLIFICIYMLLWVLNTLAVGKVTALDERGDYYVIISAVFCAIIPSSLYRRVNDRRDGIWFALLPASKLEKYCAVMLVSTVLWPAGYLLLQAVTDVLLSLAGGPEWGYTGNIFKDPPLGCDELAFLSMCTAFFACGNILFRTRKVSRSLLILLSLLLISGMSGRMCPDMQTDRIEHILPFIVTPVLWLAGYRLFRGIEY